MHIHVIHAEGEAKIWMEPNIELESSFGLQTKQIKEIIKQVVEHQDEIRQKWNDYFKR